MGRSGAFFTVLLSISCLTAGLLGGCGSSDSSTASGGKDASTSNDGFATFHGGDDATATTDDGGGGVTSLTIEPQNPEIDVTITNGQVVSVALAGDGGAAFPLTFVALANGGAALPASWAFARGELGTMSAGGGFTPGTSYAGQGIVTAAYGRVVATTNLTVKIKTTQNGGPTTVASDAGTDAGDAGDAGALQNLGGNNGVGGNLLGGPVDPATLARLSGPGTAPSSPQQLGWLYPYDKTVWPRGILAPLLQWQTTANVTAVSIHISES